MDILNSKLHLCTYVVLDLIINYVVPEEDIPSQLTSIVDYSCLSKDYGVR